MVGAAQQAQLITSVTYITRLVEPNATAIEQLIRTDNQTIRRLPADMARLKLGQSQGRRFRALRLHGNLQFILIHVRRTFFESQARAPQ